ncbi:hypothetical protein [Micromonospora sp. NPDC005197]|uniref:hypothetical protein n=1 Tax=unclassified Micromonospora TaxID=2617518 RepID=UPI0033B95274
MKTVKKPKEWPHKGQMVRVDQLETADGEKADPEAVKALDGCAAVIEERWDSKRIRRCRMADCRQRRSIRVASLGVPACRC